MEGRCSGIRIFDGNNGSSWATLLKFILHSWRGLSRAGRGGAAAGGHSPPSRVWVPVPTAPARTPLEGKGAREGQPPQAPRDRRGLCQARLFRAPSAPRDCPGLAQAALGSAAGGSGAPGHRARAEASRPPSPGPRAPALPGPRRPGPRRSSRVVLPPASQVPRGPYLAPGPGASGGGGRGRRPALLPRFRRSQELNIPPLRAAPMRKTSRQQHHLPPGAEPPPGAQPPGTPGPAPSGKARARGHGDPRGCMPRAGPDALAGKGTQEGSRRLWRQGCRCLSWHHQQGIAL
nr:translation initiation factor IF-2-like [Peromyscus maniculatus bairdii]